MAFNPSQKLVPIKEIREGVVVLKSGALRAVLLVSSINFSLKSNEEQEAIIAKFQGFLNSLDYPIQTIVQSRKLKIDKYLASIKELEKSQENELLRVQTSEYHNFIKELVASANIMNKSFYVVISYSLGEGSQKKGFFSMIKNATRSSSQVSQKRFKQLKAQLWQRVDHAAASLSGMGIRVVPLNTQELIELYYELYNPGADNKRDLSAPEEMGLKN